MKINDSLYGSHTIDDPLLITLINRPLVQRLKQINQFGIPNEYYHLKNYTRFEHSIGVMLLVKIFGASREEQIAALLHDVSHTTFSHVVDWAIGDAVTEDYQDNRHEDVLLNAGIDTLLEANNISFEKISEYKNMTLLEYDAPDLCADRIDYALRELPSSTAKTCFQDLTVYNGIFAFHHTKQATHFANAYLDLQINHWGGYEAVSRYRIFGDVLKYALIHKIIYLKDFDTTDKKVTNLLKSSKDQFIQKRLKILSNKTLGSVPKSNKIVYKKFRYVDPIIVEESGKRVSEINQEFRMKLEEARKENKKGIRFALIK